MKLDAQVTERFRSLVKKGRVIASPWTRTSQEFSRDALAEESQFVGWRDQALVSLTQVFGPDHVYTKSFVLNTRFGPYKDRVAVGLGTVEAALEDLEHGYMDTIQRIAAADVFSDLIEQAEYLLENDHWMPAVSLAGAVLENGLRSIATRNGVVVQGQDNLSSLNNKLAEKAIYSNLRRKQVALWADVRNAVDHGRFDDVNESDGADLVRGVRGFLAEYL